MKKILSITLLLLAVIFQNAFGQIKVTTLPTAETERRLKEPSRIKEMIAEMTKGMYRVAGKPTSEVYSGKDSIGEFKIIVATQNYSNGKDPNASILSLEILRGKKSIGKDAFIDSENKKVARAASGGALNCISLGISTARTCSNCVQYFRNCINNNRTFLSRFRCLVNQANGSCASCVINFTALVLCVRNNS